MKKIALTISTLLSVIVLLTFITAPSRADALTISPARLELAGDPGEVVSGEFLLINEQTETKTFYSSAENFEAQGETGTPSFTEGNTGLASWIKVIPSVNLAKGEQQKVEFTVTIPKDADAGGHFAAIFLSTIPGKDKGQVAVGAKVGVLVLLRVKGDIKEGGGILGFSTRDDQRFFTTLPVHFVYRFNNSGNDRVNPTGTIALKDTVWLTADTLNANPNQGNVLPGSTRRFDVSWGDDQSDTSADVTDRGFFGMAGYEWSHFALGMYTAKLHVQYGANGLTEASRVFFVLPWQLLIIMLLALGIILFVLSTLLKKYNRWIINKARNI